MKNWIQTYQYGKPIKWYNTINYKKWGLNDYSEAPNFNKAFKDSRSKGEKEFVWKDKRYTTDLVDKKISDNYWDSKNFLTKYYKEENYKPLSFLDSINIKNSYIKDKFGGTWLDKYKEFKPKMDSLLDINNHEEFVKLQNILDSIDIVERSSIPSEVIKKYFPKPEIENLNTPSYFSITNKPIIEKDGSITSGFHNSKSGQIFISRDTNEKVDTTPIHELSHKADTYEVSDRVPKIDVDIINKNRADFAYDQNSFDYLSSPTEIEARKMSLLYTLHKGNHPYKNISNSTLDSLYNVKGTLPSDVEQLLNLYKFQQGDLLKYLNNDFSYLNNNQSNLRLQKKQKGGQIKVFAETPMKEYFKYNIEDTGNKKNWPIDLINTAENLTKLNELRQNAIASYWKGEAKRDSILNNLKNYNLGFFGGYDDQDFAIIQNDAFNKDFDLAKEYSDELGLNIDKYLKQLKDNDSNLNRINDYEDRLRYQADSTYQNFYKSKNNPIIRERDNTFFTEANNLKSVFPGKVQVIPTYGYQDTTMLKKEINSLSDTDASYFGTMGGFNWKIKPLENGNVEAVANDIWDLHPFRNKLSLLNKYPKINKWVGNQEVGKWLGIGKPLDVKVGFEFNPKGEILRQFQKGGKTDWLENFKEAGYVTWKKMIGPGKGKVGFESVDMDDLLPRQGYKESTFLDKHVKGKNKAGAIGIAQIKQNTLKDYPELKELNLRDPKQGVKAQKIIMKDLITTPFIDKPYQPDSVTAAKALGAYNWGRTNLANYLNKQKNKGVDIYNTWDWLNGLPNETRDYINKVLRNKDPKFEMDFKKAQDNKYYKFYN